MVHKHVLKGPIRLLCSWNSPGNNSGVGSHSLLQGIFLTQGSNLGLLYCMQILHHLSHRGSPIGVQVANTLVFVGHMFSVAIT